MESNRAKRKEQKAKRRQKVPPPPPPPEDHTSELEDDGICDSILVATTEIGPDDMMLSGGRQSLEQALEKDELLVSEVSYGRVHAVGNRRGLRYAEMSELFREIKGDFALFKVEAKAKTTALEADVCALKADVYALQNRAGLMGHSFEAYKRLRWRFIHTFIRDNLKDEVSDNSLITGGNAVVHGGDAVVDADLFEGNTRSAPEHRAFELLYGLAPVVVRSLRHEPTICVLNLHASVIASKYNTGSARFYALFENFIQLFRDSSYDESYLDGAPTSVTKAYYEFRMATQTEVAGNSVAQGP